MKKITLWLFALFSCWQISAQVSGYSLSESTETYAQITGTTSTAIGDDGEQNAIPIGFSFVYGGISYTTFSISTNGIIKLGGNIVDAVDNHWTNLLTNGTQVNKPLIAPFWDDNNLSTGTIVYSLSGASPNQVLSINWHNTKIGGTGSTAGASVSTILRLYETTNVIEMVYSSPFTTANTVSASVGLNDMTSFLSVTPGATSTTSSTTANNSINATVMANLAGKKLTFTPPICFIPSGLVFANVTAYTADVSWEEPSFGSTEEYEYVLSTTNTVPTGSGDATSDTFLLFDTLTPATTYYLFVRTNCGEDGFSSWASISFTTTVACPAPTAGVSSGVTHSTATLGWTSTGTDFEINWGTGTFAAGAGDNTETGVSGTSFVFPSNLTPSTTYRWFVRRDCGVDGFSTWAGPYTFTTSIAPIAPPYSVNFTGVTALPTGWVNTNFSTVGNLTALNTGAEVNYLYKNLYSGSTTSTGNFTVRSVGEIEDEMILQFNYAVAPYQTNLINGNFIVAIAGDNGIFTDVETIILDSALPWSTIFEYDLSNYAGQNVKVRITGNWIAPSTGTADFYLGLDNFYIGLPLVCPNQTGLAVGNVSATGADFSWDDMSEFGDVKYEYAVTTSATPPVSGGIETQYTYLVGEDGLTPQTTYYLHVRVVCDIDSFGNWATSSPFTTDCAPISDLPHLETFATFMPTCWLRGANGDLASGPVTFGTSTWVADGRGNVGTTGAIRVNLDGTGGNDWILSPMFEIPATGYELRFEVSAHQWNSINAPTIPWEANDIVQVLVSTGTTNWSVLHTYDSTNVPSNVPAFNTPIDLSAYANQTVRFALRAVEGLDNERDIEFIVDNFEIRETPACPDQTGLVIGAISATGAEVSWDNMNVDGYEYAITTSATPPISGTPSATFYQVVDELDPLTTYYLHVRTVCDGNFGVWVSSASFKTECLPPNITGTTPGEVCGQGSVALSATADAGTIAWYAAETGGTALSTDATYNTPVLTETTSYWVQTSVGASGSSGKLAPPSTATGSPFTNWGIVFNATEDVDLKSVSVYSTTSGTLNIKVTNSSLTELYSTGNVPIAAGGTTTPTIVPLNFSVPAGTGYRILIKAYSGVNIIRDSEAIVFPYNGTDGVVNVTASEWGGTTTGTYYYFYDLQYEAGCTSPRTEVVATVTTASAITLSDTSVEICAGEDSSVVTLTSDASDYDTYVWEPSTGVSGNENIGWTFNPTSTTTYTLTGNQLDGAECETIITFTVNVNEKPSDIEDATIAACEDTVIPLSVEGGLINANVTSGTGTLLSPTNATDATLGPNPFQTYYGNTRQQWLYTASELIALGFVNGSTVNSFSLELSQANNYVLQNLVVKMKNSTATEFAAITSWESDMVTVKASSNHTSVIGSNSFVLDTPFVWDGTSSLVIEIEYRNNNSGGATADYTRAYYSTTTFNSTIFYRSDTAANTLSATYVLPRRNNVTFNVSLPTEVTWSPATNLYTDATATTSYVTGDTASVVYFKGSSVGSQAYTVTATSNAGCESTGTITVTVNETPDAPVAVSPQTLLGGQTLADLVVAGSDLTWYSDSGLTTEVPATTEAVDGTTYYVTQTVGSCTSDATAITVEVTLGTGNFDSTVFKVYPNPTKSILYISYNKEISTIEIYNMIGQKINSAVFNANEGQIDMSNLASGAYFVKVTSNNATKTVKIIKE